MKSVPWPIVVIVISVLASVVFLVWDGKVDSQVLVTLVSAMTGGGLLHLGRVSGGKNPPSDS